MQLSVIELPCRFHNWRFTRRAIKPIAQLQRHSIIFNNNNNRSNNSNNYRFLNSSNNSFNHRNNTNYNNW